MTKKIWDYSIYPELKDFQKKAFTCLGETLYFIQIAESQINIFSRFVLTDKINFNITDYYANKKQAKKTLGQLINKVKKIIVIHSQLDEMLESFKNKRNLFIHNLFEEQKFSISSEEGCNTVKKFCEDLQDDAWNIQNIFTNALIKWTKDNGIYNFFPEDVKNNKHITQLESKMFHRLIGENDMNIKVVKRKHKFD